MSLYYGFAACINDATDKTVASIVPVILSLDNKLVPVIYYIYTVILYLLLVYNSGIIVHQSADLRPLYPTSGDLAVSD